MVEAIRRLFKVRKGEGRQVLQFCLLSALLQAGLAIGMSAADALFLTRVGPDRLPVIYLLTPLVMLVYIPVSSYLISRFGIDRVMDLTLAALVVGGVSLSFIRGTAHPAFFYGVKLYAGLWYIALYTLFWNFADSFYDIQDAKRLFPIFSGGASTGAMLGGSLVSIASRRLPVQHLFLVWALLALITVPIAIGLRRRWHRIETEERGEKRGFVQELQETRRFARQSRYVQIFVAVLFVALALTATLEFQYSTLFAEGRSEAQLAALFGMLFAVVSGFNLIVNFLLFNRMVLWLGVGNVVIITPVVYLAAFLFFLFHHEFSAGVFGFFAYQGVLTSIDWNNTNFLFNAVPSSARSSIRTVVEGLCEPLATAAAGGFLLLFGTTQGYSLITRHAIKDGVAFLAPDSLTALGLAGAILYLVLAGFLRGSYLKSMVLNLKREWLDFARPDTALLAGLDEGQLQRLAERVRGGDRKSVPAALRILWLNDRRRALEALLKYLVSAADGDRAAAAPLLAMMLEDEDHELLRVLLEWLDAHREALSGALVQVLASHGMVPPEDAARRRQSRDPDERAAAVVAAWNHGSLEARRQALESAGSLLQGHAAERAAAIRALGWSKQERSAHPLAPFLADPDRRLRREALTAFHRLVTRDSSRLAPPLLRAIAEGDAEERLLGMEALRKIGDPASLMPLLALSDRFTPAERRQAAAVLCGIGLKSVPVAVAVLRDPRASYPARSIAARALARLAFPQLESLSPSLIRTELRRAYQCLHFHQVLEAEPVPTGERENAKERKREERKGAKPTSGEDREIGIEVGDPIPDVDFALSPLRAFAFSSGRSEAPLDHSGRIVLSRYYQDLPAVIVDFVLELLTLGGRLPDFELISASLRFGSRKERGDALETIEQGVSRDVFQRLLPLVDGRSLAERLRFFQSREALPPVTRGEIARAALASPGSLESAAGAQALWETAEPEAAALLRARLRHADPGALFRETVLALLTRREAAISMNPIERLAILARSSFFAAFSIQEMTDIAGQAALVRYERGEPIFRAGDPADTVFLIASGAARLDGDLSGPGRQAGDTLGEEGLFGQSLRFCGARSEGLSALRIPTAVVSAAARTYPRVAIGLLAEKLKVSHVP